jgi:hypothetical protein
LQIAAFAEPENSKHSHAAALYSKSSFTSRTKLTKIDKATAA